MEEAETKDNPGHHEQNEPNQDVYKTNPIGEAKAKTGTSITATKRTHEPIGLDERYKTNPRGEAKAKTGTSITATKRTHEPIGLEERDKTNPIGEAEAKTAIGTTATKRTQRPETPCCTMERIRMKHSGHG